MTFLSGIRSSVAALAAVAKLEVPAAGLPESITGLSDGSVRELLGVAADLSRSVATLQALLAGVAAVRSRRDRGHGGFSAESSHRSPAQLLQELTGSSRGEASRLVQAGESLLGGVVGVGGARGDAASGDPVVAEVRWDQPLTDAVLAGRLSTAQHHAIRVGLGAPPVAGSTPGHGESVAAECGESVVLVAWRAGAVELISEASGCTVEDLAARARALRDLLDPATAEERFAARFAKRAVRWSTDPDGLSRAHITFDDEMGAWVRALREAALSPRRGGPRFVAEGERSAAEDLVADLRSTEQLEYDLLVDLLRAGSRCGARCSTGPCARPERSA